MAAERTPGDFGSMLKAARERRGVSLRQIARATKISVAALDALERNDVSRLPGGIFSRAFVRAYALEVGLDPDQTIQEFAAQFPDTTAAPGQAAAEQLDDEEVHDSNQQTASTFVRLIVISVPLVGGLLYFGSGRLSTPPAAARPGADQPSPASAPAIEKDTKDSTASSAAVESPALSGEVVTVGVVATAPCWVAAIVDGERKVTRELQTGERMVFEGGRSVVLTAGDPAALAVTINGEEARPLGTAGRIVTIRLTPSNFKEFLSSP
jgi:cytoskeletal protein RodZ